MIKINLLPHLKAKKVKQQAAVQYQLWLVGGVFVALIGIIGYFWFYLNARLDALQVQKAELVRELDVLKQKAREVEGFERDKKAFEEKIRIIRQLKLNQSGPVQLLDQISRSLPLRVWLVEIDQRGRNVTIKGKALSNPELVDFIENLRKSEIFSVVNIEESRLQLEQEIPVYNFRLNCQLSI